MRVLYAIQTTGNGHLSRAKELIPYFERRFQVIISLLTVVLKALAFQCFLLKLGLHYHLKVVGLKLWNLTQIEILNKYQLQNSLIIRE